MKKLTLAEKAYVARSFALAEARRERPARPVTLPSPNHPSILKLVGPPIDRKVSMKTRKGFAKEVADLKEFAKIVIRHSVFDGAPLDGGNIQDLAARLGLLVETQFDPAIHGESRALRARRCLVRAGAVALGRTVALNKRRRVPLPNQ